MITKKQITEKLALKSEISKAQAEIQINNFLEVIAKF
jgi:nucleoid DNA-binding protein